MTWGAREPGAGHPEAALKLCLALCLLKAGQLCQRSLPLCALCIGVLAGLRPSLCEVPHTTSPEGLRSSSVSKVHERAG